MSPQNAGSFFALNKLNPIPFLTPQMFICKKELL